MKIGSKQHSFKSYASVLTLDHQWQLQLMGAVHLLMHPVSCSMGSRMALNC